MAKCKALTGSAVKGLMMDTRRRRTASESCRCLPSWRTWCTSGHEVFASQTTSCHRCPTDSRNPSNHTARDLTSCTGCHNNRREAELVVVNDKYWKDTALTVTWRRNSQNVNHNYLMWFYNESSERIYSSHCAYGTTKVA